MRLIDADEARESLNERLKCCNTGSIIEACYLSAIDILDATLTIAPPPNDPLTLEELREMDGEPVWCVDGRGNECWRLVNVHDGIPHCYDSQTGFYDGTFYGMQGDGKHDLHELGWIAYRHKPEKGEEHGAV